MKKIKGKKGCIINYNLLSWKSLVDKIAKIKEDHLEEQNDLMQIANEAQRENKILKTKCHELQHQVDEVEEDLQTTEEETLRMEFKFRREQKTLRRNSEILQKTARLKVREVFNRCLWQSCSDPPTRKSTKNTICWKTSKKKLQIKHLYNTWDTIKLRHLTDMCSFFYKLCARFDSLTICFIT